MKEMAQMFGPLFKKSSQAIYLYLDDEHKICNEKFAKLLGYKSPREWVKNLYPVDDLARKDQKKGIKAFMEASNKLKASTVSGTWIRKGGKKINTNVTMVPFPYSGEVFVLHFISPK